LQSHRAFVRHGADRALIFRPSVDRCPQDDAVPCVMTPKRLRGAEDMFANMRIDE
jgi:hypothetical protein